MASLKQQTFKMFFGLYVDAEVAPKAQLSDTITTTDTVGYDVVVNLKETVRVNENFVLFFAIKDLVTLEETMSARAKGATKTLFITDERYFKAKNA